MSETQDRHLRAVAEAEEEGKKRALTKVLIQQFMRLLLAIDPDTVDSLADENQVLLNRIPETSEYDTAAAMSATQIMRELAQMARDYRSTLDNLNRLDGAPAEDVPSTEGSQEPEPEA